MPSQFLLDSPAMQQKCARCNGRLVAVPDTDTKRTSLVCINCGRTAHTPEQQAYLDVLKEETPPTTNRSNRSVPVKPHEDTED